MIPRMSYHLSLDGSRLLLTLCADGREATREVCDFAGGKIDLRTYGRRYAAAENEALRELTAPRPAPA